MVLEWVFWVSLIAVVYVYFGYAAFLAMLQRVVGKANTKQAEPTMPVTVIISAFDEEGVIGQKIRNTLSLDYPRSALEILVVSDASQDRTDEIVRSFRDEPVKLIRMEERCGKTVGLNRAVPEAAGEIIVFSDANAMFEPQALRFLCSHFADDLVGAVVGESTYVESTLDAAKSESLYWRYEVMLKTLESSLGSVVGGDGAIYAIRRELYKSMRSDALSDFVNPCQIVMQGRRCIYEPRAISVEEAAGSFEKEFRRKIRIVNRAWRATWAMRPLLNPLRFGLFSVQLISHKLLRWVVPLFLIVILGSNLVILDRGGIYWISLTFQVGFFSLAVLGWFRRGHSELPVVLYVPYYFCLVNCASALGIMDAYRGKTYTTWSTARTNKV